MREDAYERFRRSMDIGYEQWHDGIGYDLEAIREAGDDVRVAIERLLLPRATDDWRDVQALAVLNTPNARAALEQALDSPDPEIRVSVLRYAPDLVDDERHTDVLVQNVATATIGGGLVQTLDAVAEFHPPRVVDALLRGAREQDGGVAVHLAAMLLFVHGLTTEHFDMDERPFLLRFHATGDDRRQVFEELCARIGVTH